MASFNQLINKKYLLAFVILILLIISIAGAIFIVDSKKSTPLVSYNSFKQKVEDVNKIDKISNNHSYNVFLKKIANLGDPNTSKAQQLSDIKFAWTYLYGAYSETNDPALYKLSLEFKKFANANFGESFSPNVQCLDPKCAEKPISKGITAIMDEISTSSVPAGIKDDYAQQLKSTSYMGEEDSDVKVVNYLSLAESLRIDEDFTKAGINLKIYNEIRDYVKATYPDLYDKYSSKIKVQAL